MRYALSMLLAACFAPTAETGVPCASNFDCPANQTCNRTVAPPTCGTPTITGDAAAPDAGGDANAPLGPWGAPALVMTPVTLEDDATLTADLRELYFNRDQTTIWRISRAGVGAPWSAPVEVPELAPATTPELTADGLTMYLASARAGSIGQNDIWVATRASTDAAWSAPTRVPEVSTLAEESNATPSTDHLTLLLVKRGSLSLGVDIFAATRSSITASWGAPIAIAALNTAAADGDAMLTADKLSVYFYSTRSGMGDLYVATRSTVQDAFGAPQPIAELDTPQFVEQDPWISSDDRHLIFASDRSGQMAIYESTR